MALVLEYKAKSMWTPLSGLELSSSWLNLGFGSVSSVSNMDNTDNTLHNKIEMQ